MAKQKTADKKEQTAEKQAAQQFAIQRLYIKDFSFETEEGLLDVFQEQWKPELQLDIHTDSNKLSKANFEVVLRVTVTVKSAKKTVFLVEVKQAGLFAIDGLDGEQLRHCLGSYCPSILYPYARESISNVVTRASLPQLILAPVNFDALYARHKEEQAKQDGEKK